MGWQNSPVGHEFGAGGIAVGSQAVPRSRMHPPGGTKHMPPPQLALLAHARPVLVQTPAAAPARVVTSPACTPPGAAAVRIRAVATRLPVPPDAHIPAASAMATLKVWSTRSSVSPSPFRSSPCSASKVRKVTVLLSTR